MGFMSWHLLCDVRTVNEYSSGMGSSQKQAWYIIVSVYIQPWLIPETKSQDISVSAAVI